MPRVVPGIDYASEQSSHEFASNKSDFGSSLDDSSFERENFLQLGISTTKALIEELIAKNQELIGMASEFLSESNLAVSNVDNESN